MSKNAFTSALKTAGRATAAGASLLMDAKSLSRIAEIDVQIKELQEERARLEAGLISKH